MTPPIQPQSSGFDYEGARRAGLTPAMIDDYLRRHPQGPPRPVQVQSPEGGAGPSVAAPALPNTVQRPDNAPTATGVPEGYAGQFNRGLARQAAQGLTMGFADEIEAGGRALFGGGHYKDIRNDIRAQNEDFSGENPLLALGANIVPGMATGTAVGAGLRAVGMGGKALAAGAGLGSKLIAAGKAGMGYGAVAGAGAAPELRDVPLSAGMGAGMGGAIGMGGAALGEMVGGARNLVAGTGADAARTGPVRNLIQSQGPDQAAAQRVMRMLKEAGFKNLDEVAAASGAAAPEAAVAELSANGKAPGIKGLRVSRNMGRERDVIDQALTERAAEEPANWSRTLAKTTGVAEPRDAKVVGKEALNAVEKKVTKSYGRAYKRPAVADPRIAEVVDVLESLPEFGKDALRRAESLSIGRDKTNPFPRTFREDAPPSLEARTDMDGLRDFSKVKTESLIDEIERQQAQMNQATGAAQYNRSDPFSGGSGIDRVTVATRKAGSKVSEQAKAAQRLELGKGVHDRAIAELEKRNVDWEQMLVDRAERGAPVDPVSAARKAVSDAEGDLALGFGNHKDLSDARLKLDAVEKASAASRVEPALKPVTVAHMHDLRKGLDEVIGGMEQQVEQGNGSPEMLRVMKGLRKRVDKAAKSAGGLEFRRADRLTERAMAKGESFAAGGRVEQIGTAEGVGAARDAARDPEAFRQGVASKLQERASGISDGEAGQVRNPTQGALGSRTRRARTAEAFMGPKETPLEPGQQGPQGAFPAARADAKEIAKRLDTRRMVSSNSTTTANIEEAADEFMSNPEALAKLVLQPTSALKLMGGAALNRAKGINTAQATQMGRLLSGGLPGQMSRDEVLAILRDAEPAAVQKILRDVGRRGGAAGATARMGTEKNAR